MIRKATKADIPRLAEIVIYGWRTAYRGIVSDEVLFNPRPWKEETYGRLEC